MSQHSGIDVDRKNLRRVVRKHDHGTTLALLLQNLEVADDDAN